VNIFKIFTGVITNWDDPALAADNPGLRLPNQSIVPVVRSDGSGTSYELSAWDDQPGPVPLDRLLLQDGS